MRDNLAVDRTRTYIKSTLCLQSQIQESLEKWYISSWFLTVLEKAASGKA